MHSSISSSERALPEQRWGAAAALAGLLFLAGVAAWELYWRAQQFEPSYIASDGLWAKERRRVDREGDHATVLIGSSRTLFDIDLDVWAEVVGSAPPIQLALEGTGAMPALRDIAADPDFSGFLVVGYVPGLFHINVPGFRESVFGYYRNETPSQWLGQRISMLLEMRLAFLDEDSRLKAILGRQPWPQRAGMRPPHREVRRLMTLDPRREAKMWRRVEEDAAYRELCRDIWRQFLDPPPFLLPTDESVADRVAETTRLVAQIRARGGEVVFIRLPSSGEFRDAERRIWPRERCWDPLLAGAGVQGFHFEDHPELMEFDPPEWSHLAAGDTEEFTRRLARLVRPSYERWKAE
jgi:hypothetical protein